MLYKKQNISNPLPELGNQDSIEYLNQVIQHIELIRSGKGGVNKNKADLSLNILLQGIINAWDSFANLPDEKYQQKTDDLVAFIVEKAGPQTPLGQWFSQKSQTQENYAGLMTRFGALSDKQDKPVEKTSQNIKDKTMMDPKKILLQSMKLVLKQQHAILNQFKSLYQDLKQSMSSSKEPEKNIDTKNTPRYR